MKYMVTAETAGNTTDGIIRSVQSPGVELLDTILVVSFAGGVGLLDEGITNAVGIRHNVSLSSRKQC